MVENSGGSVCAYGAGVLLRHLHAMLVEEPGVRRALDIEHVHRMRVASRRLRAALPLFAPCFPDRKVANWSKALRGVTRSLGEARDMDVQIEVITRFLAGSHQSQLVPGLRRLQVRWTQKRQELQKKVVKALDENQKTRVFEKMGATLLPFTLGIEPGAPPQYALYELANNAVLSSLDDFLSFEPFITQPDRVAELHQMRIAAKELRYRIELFSPLYSDGLSGFISTMKNSQDLLGEIHDCDVWQEAVPQFLEEEKQRVIGFYGTHGPWNLLLPGVKAFLADRLASREESYQTFLRKWQTWTAKGIWTSLRQTTGSPLIDRTALYPIPGSRPLELPQSEGE